MSVERPLRFIRLPEVQRRVPYSKSSIYAMVANGLFPAPHRLGARAVGWLENEVAAFIEARSVVEPRASDGRTISK